MNKKLLLLAIVCLMMPVTSLLCYAQRQVIHPEIKAANPSPVYDFIERYFTEIEKQKDPELLRLKLKDDKVEVLEGSLSAIHSITTSTPFSLNRMSDSFYQIAWTSGSKHLLTLRFPVNYELLLGMPKVQIEKKMKEYINNSVSVATTSDNTEQEYEATDDGLYKTKPSMFYQLQAFNDVRYYNKVDDKYVPVFDENHNWYSAANLFQGIVDAASRNIYIEQNLYGGQKMTYTVTLANWLNYCSANKLKIYFCVEEEHTDGIKALLIAHSSDMNYNHMMQLIIPDNFIDKQNCIIKATLNAFIPTQNVKNLYQKYTSKAKKKI